jgi:cellulose synthase/poly-beta-1,6-N-acetylglucosamine synthase-like glycosyltransferase
MGMDGADHQRAAYTLDAAELETARLGFHRAHLRRSAKRPIYITQWVGFGALIAGIVWAWRTAPGITWNVVHYGALALFGVAIAWRLIAASNLKRLLWRIASPEQWPTYTVLCPLYREANVLPDLVASLQRLDYPQHALQVILLVEGDDRETLNAALSAATSQEIEVVIVPAATPRTKPKALNAGLARARGEYLVVYDAEDRPHSQQLRAALAEFQDGGEQLACLQAPLDIDNAEDSWIARQFAAEYAIQFREMLPMLARLKLPLPLGGSSNHFRTAALRATGGWDPFNVTEDADLGYRLARDGYVSGVIGPPTFEEAPITLGAWLNQRTRWIKGHMQSWLVLMRDPILAAREMGLAGFASMQLMLGGGVIATFAHGPLAFIVLVAALTPYDLLKIEDFILVVIGYTVAMLAALSACALSGNPGHAKAAFTMPLYWPLASLAAWRAFFELLFRPHHWSKTTHGVSQTRRPPPARMTGLNQRSALSRPHMASTSPSL